MLGTTPIGHPEFVTVSFGADHGGTQSVAGPNPSSAGCAAVRANCLLWVVRPVLVRQFAESHDAGLWRCLCWILDIPEGQCEATAWIASSVPFLLGGIGLGEDKFASWGDCLHMVHRGILTSQSTIGKLVTNHICPLQWPLQES